MYVMCEKCLHYSDADHVNHARVRARIFAVKREASRRIERVKVNDRSVCNEKFHPPTPPVPSLPFPSLSPFSAPSPTTFASAPRKILVGESLFTNGPQGEYDSSIDRIHYERVTVDCRSVGKGVKGVRDYVMSARTFLNIETGKCRVLNSQKTSGDDNIRDSQKITSFVSKQFAAYRMLINEYQYFFIWPLKSVF